MRRPSAWKVSTRSYVRGRYVLSVPALSSPSPLWPSPVHRHNCAPALSAVLCTPYCQGGAGQLTTLGSVPLQLSPHVVAGLHEVARCVDVGSFAQSLEVHAQVVGCSSFSEVSSFMPILKAVLTIAHKLQG